MVALDQPSTESSITGGVLGEDKYRFLYKKYLWTNDPNGVAATTIDGIGYSKDCCARLR